VVANPTIDVLGALAELELGRVHTDDDQTVLGVMTLPRLDVRRGADPVDAGIFPEIDEHDFAAQHVARERR
jgi:hypothetical protein